MPSISISVTAGATTTRTRTISAAHLIRFINAYRSIFENPALTDEEVFLKWADMVLSGAKRVVRDYENRSATDAAVIGQSDIGLT